MSIHYIGITGKARAGKDTLASELERALIRANKFAYFNRVSFAAPLYAIADLFQFDTMSDTFKTDVHPIFKMTGRAFLQKVGTDLFRNHLDQNIWVKLAEANADCLYRAQNKQAPTLFVFPDLRFDNEAQFIKSKGGIIIKVLRPESPLALKGQESAHASENGVSEGLIDIQWSNEEGRLDVMEKFANNIINELMLKGSEK